MSKILNAVKGKFNILKENAKLRYILISVFALLLIVSVTLAWYINKVSLWGVEFNTGNIEFNTYVYNESGKRLAGPVSSAASDLPFGCGEPSAIGQQAIVCPHCHQALVMNIASYEQK